MCKMTMAAGRAWKFGSALKEIRIHLCQKSEQSKGVREFIEKNFVGLKESNPKFPILVRECSGVQPRAFARYEFGKEKSVPLTNLKAEEVSRQLESLTRQ